MLSQLKIKDFAIIDDLTINFENRMTVLTGETGSGKSIIIDAINLLLGERASNELIRFDKEKAFIEGLFYYDNPQVDQLLEEYGIINDEKILIVVREISKNGRNICRLNGNLISVNQLKNLGRLLIDVHVQHDTTRLITTNNYIYLLDSFCDEEFKFLLKEYQESLATYYKNLKDYKNLIKEHQLNQEKLEIYQFQLEEFQQAKISLSEYLELDNKRNQYTNFDKIYENLNFAYNNIKENNILENIYSSSSHLAKIAHINSKYNDIKDLMLASYYQLEDLINEIFSEINLLDYNPKELERIDSRLSIYSNLKRKYKMGVEDLINYYENLTEKIGNIENFDSLIGDLEKKIQQQFTKAFDLAKRLRLKRIEIAKEIETSLVTHLYELKLANTTFKIIFNDYDDKLIDCFNNQLFNEKGIDTIDFNVSFNLGEPLKPLSKVASGGELSRFMLGLKTILSEKQHLSTIIFDEIDTGVSGITASSIAQKIKSISNTTQVFCITHLPQVASVADNHLYISKMEKNERTNTIVTALSKKERIIEIAKMIAGNDINDVVIQNAKNLLKIE